MADFYAARKRQDAGRDPADDARRDIHGAAAKAIDLGFADGVIYEGEDGTARPAALITLKDLKWPRSTLDDRETAERARFAAEARAMKEAADRITWKPGT
jgi:hypothetical protein